MIESYFGSVMKKYLKNKFTVLVLLLVIILTCSLFFALFSKQTVAFILLILAFILMVPAFFLIYKMLDERTVSLRSQLQNERRTILYHMRSQSSPFYGASIGAITGSEGQKNSKNNYPLLGDSLNAFGYYFGVGPEYAYAKKLVNGGHHIATHALLTKSVRIRDVFARAATRMQFNYNDLIRMIWTRNSGKLPELNKLVPLWDRRMLLILAGLIANQNLDHDDPVNAYRLFRTVVDAHGVRALRKNDVYIMAEVANNIGEYRSARQVFLQSRMNRKDSVHYSLLTANQHRPEDGDWEPWLERVNEIYDREGLAPIGIKQNGATPLDRIYTKCSSKTIDGPLVTVIVPTYEGADKIATTLDSLVAQTWKNIEIIVVDDASPEESYDQLVSVCERYGDAVTLLRQKENQGAYCARNLALSKATGEYITVHDDDDWSHAQKIEYQMKFLIDNPEEIANMSRHVRTFETLEFSRINNNPSFSQPNYSSLLLKTDTVRELGGWDKVNRGADGEFRDRLVAKYGCVIPTIGKAPLSFTRIHNASLTAGEFGKGYVDSSRLFYLASYMNSLDEAKEDDKKDIAIRDFIRPENMKPGQRHGNFGHFDVIFITDFRYPGGTSSLTLNEIQHAASMNLRVGVVHALSPINGPQHPITTRLFEVCKSSNVEILSLLDHVSADFILLRHPTVLQYADGLQCNFKVGKVAVVVNNPPVLSGGTGYWFDVKDVLANGTKLFGVKPDIVPESEVTRKLCTQLVNKDYFANYNWPGFIDISKYPFVEREMDHKPVVGRHSRPQREKWPDSLSTIEQLYINPNYETVILGGLSGLPQQAQDELNANTTVYDFGALDVAEYLRNIDFWVYHHSARWTESFGMCVAEAMASGMVVFLPEYMKDNFGEGALYTKPEKVAAEIAHIWASPDEYAELTRKSRRVVEERYSHNAFEKRLLNAISEGNELLSNS